MLSPQQGLAGIHAAHSPGFLSGGDAGFSSGGGGTTGPAPGGMVYQNNNRSMRAWNSQANFRKHKRWLKRRSGAYDEDGVALLQAGTGLRVWYDDFTTIGIHCYFDYFLLFNLFVNRLDS